LAHRGLLAGVIFTLVALQGITINLMPVLFGPIARSFGANLRQQGQLQSFFLAGGLTALFLSGYLTEWIGARRSAGVAVGLITLGALGFGFAGSYVQVLGAALLLGSGNSWILAVYSAVITARFADVRQRMFMWATAAFAGSAALSTMLLGHLMETLPTWNTVFLGLAGMVAMGAIGFRVVAGASLRTLDTPQRRQPAPPLRLAVGMNESMKRVRQFITAGLMNRPVFWLLGLLVILDVIAAGNIVAWTGRFFQKEYGVGDDQVGLMLSVSSAGVFLGRIFMGTFVSGRFTDRAVLATAYTGAMIAYVALLLIPNYPVGLALIFLNGACIAAQAPTMYAIASGTFGSRAATAIPLMDAIGTLGGLVAPTVVGQLGDHYGLRAVLWLVPAVGMFLVAIVVAWLLVDRHRDAGATAPNDPTT
jgi:MFS family permease